MSKCVYLTRNGHGECGILTMDEPNRQKAAYKLISKLSRAEEQVNQEGWNPDEAVKKERGTYDFNKEWQGGRPCNRRG